MDPRRESSLRKHSNDLLRTLNPPDLLYIVTVVFLFAVLGFGVYTFSYQVQTGLGLAWYQHPIQWAVYITNFVFWIGITHSGTLISAVLFLFRATWRTGVARASEAMTVFAIMIGALFPIIHLGRSHVFYWLMPFPNERQLWVNFRSPLVWDLIAIMAYLTVRVTFGDYKPYLPPPPASIWCVRPVLHLYNTLEVVPHHGMVRQLASSDHCCRHRTDRDWNLDRKGYFQSLRFKHQPERFYEGNPHRY